MRKNDWLMPKIFLILSMLAIVVAGCANVQTAADNLGSEGKNENDKAPAYKTISTGSLETGDVVVGLTPKGVEDGKLLVEFSLNTHSVELSPYNLMQITSLEYGGKAIKPASAPKLRGHHGSGTLIFDVGNDFDINNFNIIIKGIPNVNARTFEWENNLDNI